MKRVAIFRTELLPLSETFVRDQACALRTWQPVLVGRCEVEHGLATPRIPRELVPQSGSRFARELRSRLWRPDPALAARLEALQVDLVHVHFGVDATDIWPTVKAAGLPMVVSLHGFDINTHRSWWEAGHGGSQRRSYPARLLKMASQPGVAFIAVSEAVKRRAVEYGVPAEKVTVIYTGVDTGRFRPAGLPIAGRANRILFVGRMVENKAPTLLARACAAIAPHVPGLELMMIGGGPELEATRQFALASGLDIALPGPQPAESVLDALHHAKVLCLPSQQIASGTGEGLGQVLLEAQACGVPVVGSTTGGIPEAFQEGSTGYLFRSGDQDELQEALLKVLRSDDERLATLSAACRNFAVERFDLARTIVALERVYDAQVANDRRRAA